MSLEISHFISNNEMQATKWPHEVPNRSGKVTKNFTLGEWLDSMFFVNDAERQSYVEHSIPFNSNLHLVPQLIRDTTGKPVYLGSSFRSPKWEKKKGRAVDGDHPTGNAVDVNGQDVYNVIYTAVQEKNELYKQLQALGVNAFGFYPWGVHLGMRKPKTNGEDYVWHNSEKKKANDWFLSPSVAIALIPLFLYRKTIFRFIKRLFR